MSDQTITTEDIASVPGDTHPSGVARFGPLACPHCGVESFVQMPGEEHTGTIKAECGTCGKPFLFDSPHAPAPAEAVVVPDGHEVVSMEDQATPAEAVS